MGARPPWTPPGSASGQPIRSVLSWTPDSCSSGGFRWPRFLPTQQMFKKRILKTCRQWVCGNRIMNQMSRDWDEADSGPVARAHQVTWFVSSSREHCHSRWLSNKNKSTFHVRITWPASVVWHLYTLALKCALQPILSLSIFTLPQTTFVESMPCLEQGCLPRKLFDLSNHSQNHSKATWAKISRHARAPLSVCQFKNTSPWHAKRFRNFCFDNSSNNVWLQLGVWIWQEIATRSCIRDYEYLCGRFWVDTKSF